VVPQPPASRTIFRLNDFDARDAFRDYYSSRSLHGRGEALVVLNNTTSEAEGANYRLRNPVIVMDGFDPNDESKLTGSEGTSIYELLESSRILDALDATQRDLVILNFPVSSRLQAGGGRTSDDIDGGTDYVERNAYVLETLLNDLKARTYVNPAGQRDKYTVLGPSMGGLISRYALAHMEQQQQLRADAGQPADPWWDHNTATWISFDTPHMGANIPLADQQFLFFYYGVSDGARANLEQRLNSVAAKQFLVAHFQAPGYAVAGSPGYRDRFMLALRDNGERNSLGYPVHLRRVAIANGKLNGALPPSADGTPGGKAFQMEIRTNFWQNWGNAFISFFGFSYKSTNPSLITTCTAFFLPHPNSTVLNFYGLSNQTSGVRWGTTSPTAIKFIRVLSGPQGSWDLAPGGLRDTQQQLRNQTEAASRELKVSASFTDFHPNHCFVPTVSALGFQYQSTSSYQNTSSLPNPFTNLLTRGNLVCTGETPFDDFYAPAATNTAHVSADAGAQAFLFRELTPRVATPVFTAGPISICPAGGTFTYSVGPVCVATRPGQQQPTTTYNWTVTAGGTFAGNVQQLTGAGSTQMVTIAPAPSNSSVTVSVTAVRAGAAAGGPVSESVHITDAYATVTAPGEVVKYDTFTAALDQANTVGPYTWSISPSVKASISNPSTATGPSVQVVARNAGQITITATGTDVCTGAAITAASATVTITTGGLRPAPARAAAYPNPADDVLTLAAPEAAVAAGLRTAVLYSAQGREVRRTRAGEAQVSTADLPSGLYYLMVAQNGQVKRSQIRVQH